MKKLFKIFGIIVVTTAMIFTVIGCGNDTTDTGDKTTDVKADYTPSATAASYMDANLKFDSATQNGQTVTVKLSGTLTEPYTAAGKTLVESMSVGANEGWLDPTKKAKGFAVLILRGVVPEADEYPYFRVTETNDSIGIYGDADTHEQYEKVSGHYTKKSGAPEWEVSAPASEETDRYIWSMLWADAATKTITYVVEYSNSGTEGSAAVAKKTVTVDWSGVDLSGTAE